MTYTSLPGYTAIHFWVRYHLGNPKECSACGFKSANSRQFHWANVSKEYNRDLNDWIRLCASCHIAFDNEPRQECVKGHKFTKDNTYYKNDKYAECKICRKDQVRKFRSKNKDGK